MTNKKMAIIGAVLIGAFIVLRKPKTAEAGILPDEPEDNSLKPSVSMDTVLNWAEDNKTERPQTDSTDHTSMVNGYTANLMNSLNRLVKTETSANGESGTDPLSTPIPGRYYQVKTGDTQTGVCVKAGLSARSWRAMRDHFKNDWIPKTYKNGSFFPISPSEKSLAFYKWFTPPGYQTYCLYKQAPATVFPVIYIPSKEEV